MDLFCVGDLHLTLDHEKAVCEPLIKENQAKKDLSSQ